MKKLLFITSIIVSIILYVALAFTNVEPMVENYTGIFESENVQIILNSDDDNRYGSLSINEFVYSVTAKQINPGVIEGFANDGENSIPFSLSQGKWQILLPEQYVYSSLEMNNKSYSLKRSRNTEFDLSGKWRGLGTSLEIQKSDDGQWLALFKSDRNEKTLLSFKQNGHLIDGFFRDNGLNFFTGKYSQDTEQIALIINNKEYRFSNAWKLRDDENGMMILAPGSVFIQAFEGVFQVNDTKLSISIRQGEQDSDNEKKPSICEVRLFIKTRYVTTNNCTMEKNHLQFNFRTTKTINAITKAQTSKIATVALTTEGVKFMSPSLSPLYLERVRNPLLAGRYETEKGTIIELLTLKGDIWEGYFHSKGVEHPFKGRFSANRLEGVNLYKNNRTQTFVISSEIIGGTIAWDRGRAVPIKLTYINPNQPHDQDDLMLIQQYMK